MELARSILVMVRELSAWSVGRRCRFRVIGVSMEPTLRHGDFVLIDVAQVADVGDLALAFPPGDEQLRVIKRVDRHTSEGDVWLASDNLEQGVDSRRWGPVRPANVLGRVTLNLTHPLAPL